MGLEVTAEKAKYMVMSRDQKAGQNRKIKIGNSSFEKCGIAKIIRNKFWIIQKQIEVRKCMLPFGAESCIFQFAIKKYKD